MDALAASGYDIRMHHNHLHPVGQPDLISSADAALATSCVAPPFSTLAFGLPALDRYFQTQ